MNSQFDESKVSKMKSKIDYLQSILSSEINSRHLSEIAIQDQFHLVNEKYAQSQNSNLLFEGIWKLVSAELMEFKKEIKSEIGSAIANSKPQLNSPLIKPNSTLVLEDVDRPPKSDLSHFRNLNDNNNNQGDSYDELKYLINTLESKMHNEISHMQHSIDVSLARTKSDMASDTTLALERLSQSITIDINGRLNNSILESRRLYSSELAQQTMDIRSSHNELKSIVAAEITARRKTHGKMKETIANLNDMVKITENKLVDLQCKVESYKAIIDEDVLRIASTFSEQLLTLQSAAKSGLNTLQVVQSKAAFDLRDTREEFKQECLNIRTSLSRIEKHGDRDNQEKYNEVSSLKSKIDELQVLLQNEIKSRDIKHSTYENSLKQISNQYMTQISSCITEKQLQERFHDEFKSIVSEEISNERINILEDYRKQITNSIESYEKAVKTDIKGLESKILELAAITVANEESKSHEEESEDLANKGLADDSRKVLLEEIDEKLILLEDKLQKKMEIIANELNSQLSAVNNAQSDQRLIIDSNRENILDECKKSAEVIDTQVRTLKVEFDAMESKLQELRDNVNMKSNEIDAKLESAVTNMNNELNKLSDLKSNEPSKDDVSIVNDVQNDKIVEECKNFCSGAIDTHSKTIRTEFETLQSKIVELRGIVDESKNELDSKLQTAIARIKEDATSFENEMSSAMNANIELSKDLLANFHKDSEENVEKARLFENEIRTAIEKRFLPLANDVEKLFGEIDIINDWREALEAS
jgi:uncharacterized protein YoxC